MLQIGAQAAALLIVASTASGRIMARTGPRLPMLTGLMLGGAGLLGLTVAGSVTPYPFMIVPMAAAGFGMALDPVVTWLERHRFPRWAAVLTILVAAFALLGGFAAAAIPPLVSQATALAHHLPQYANSLKNHNPELGKLNSKYHLQQRLSSLLSSKGSALVGRVLGAGEVVLSAATSMILIAVIVIYFLSSMPRIRLFAYRLAPHSRRTRSY